MGSTNPPVLIYTLSPSMDKIPPVGHNIRVSNKQHSFYHTNSVTMVQYMQVRHQGIQLQTLYVALEHPNAVPKCLHTQPTGIFGVNNIHLPHHPTISTGDAHTGLYRQLKCSGFNAQGII